MNTATQGQVLMLDPSEILVSGSNIRYSLKKHKVEALKASIIAAGEVQVPVEVELLPKPVDGKKYGLITGHYRHESATQLNENGGGVKLPAIVRTTADPTDRLKRQLRENVERESLSPMDEAVAIGQLITAGVAKPEIRQIFAKPGGRKGMTMAPVSNAYINMIHSFLDFPKDIRDKIHDGRLPIGAAYELRKAPKEKWADILTRAEDARQKQMDEEEKEETRFLSGEKKAAQTEEKAKTLETELEKAETVFKEAEKVAKEKAEAATEAFKATQTKPEAKTKAEADTAKKKAAEHFKAAQAESAAATKELEKAKRTLDTLQGKAKAARINAQIKADKLKAAREAAAAKKAPAADGKAGKGKGTVTQADVKAAASNAPKPPSAQEIRNEINTLALPGSCPKVMAIGEIFKQYVMGILTPAQIVPALVKVTGEEALYKKGGVAKK
jgi:hypothetical protein